MAVIEERVSKDGDKAYRVKIRIKGFPPTEATFDRKTDARQWASKTEASMREGRYFPEAVAKKKTISDLIDRYVREVVPDKEHPDKDKQRLEWWRGALGFRVLSEVTPDIIAEARDKLASEPMPRKVAKEKPEPKRKTKATMDKAPTKVKPPKPASRAPATVNRYMAVLSHAFTMATKEWGWVNYNPFMRVRKKKEPSGRVRYLEGEELKVLLEACKASKAPYLHAVVVVALSTGMRQGEILGLKWRDVDLTRGHLVLHKTKNGDRRGLPLHGQALEVLKVHGGDERDLSALVFPGTTSFRHAWGRAVAKSQLEDFKFHDLRHTAASYLAMNGATPSEIAAVLGHKTLAMVKRYAHLSDSHTSEVVRRMNEKFLMGF